MPNLIGTAPDQVPTNGSLGNMAFQNKEGVVTDLLSTTALTVTGTGVMSVGGTQIFKNTNGNVGIGTGTPARTLEVNGSIRVANANRIEWGGDQYYIAGDTAGAMIFGAAGPERMRLDSSGNVGIGTTAPAARLHVVNSTVNAQLRLQDVTTDATNKYGVVGTGHYTNAQSPILAMGVGSLSASNTIYIGGGFGALNAATAVAFYTAANNTTLTGTERMRIDNAGQVGIGVTPMTTGANGNLLQIGNPTTNSGSGLTIGSTTTADIQFSDATTGTGQYAGLIRYSHSTDHMALWTASAERMRIDSAGNVGIGTTPSVRLDVNNGGASVEQWIRTGTGFSSTLFLKPNGSGGGLRFQAEAGETATIYNTLNSPLTFGTNNTERMRIDTSGNLMVGTTSSSGSASNTTRVIGGVFSTLRSSASVANNTATTIATLPSGEGNYMVSASLVSSGTPSDYNEVAMVCVSITTASITTLVNASQLSLSMSGLNLQVTHLQGLTQTIQYSVLRIL